MRGGGSSWEAEAACESFIPREAGWLAVWKVVAAMVWSPMRRFVGETPKYIGVVSSGDHMVTILIQIIIVGVNAVALLSFNSNMLDLRMLVRYMPNKCYLYTLRTNGK